MCMPITLHLSVHDIVDVLLRRGHLDTRIFNQASMLEGSRLHTLYQREQQDGYHSEYPLSYKFYEKDYIFDVSGKADGVYINPLTQEVTVEEIKTTVADLDEFIKDHGEWHLGQAIFYAFMLSEELNKDEIIIKMTYLRQQNYKSSKNIIKLYKKEDLNRFVNDLILRYTKYQERIIRYKNERDESCKGLKFPFNTYREGQQEMMDVVSKNAEYKEEVYIEAPTGIGKTISVLYPLVLRFGEKKQDRIYYLTSKNSIKQIAMNTMALFKKEGCKCKSIEFTARENICFNDKKGHCNPDECPFAKHYYDKLMDAIFDSLANYDTFDRKRITSISFDRQMCPYQFQLDLSLYCDVLVLDYSYVYDYHDRLDLQEGSLAKIRSALCVDECHNLPDRVRDMYSIEIDKKEFEDAITYCGYNELSLIKKDIKQIIKEIEKIPLDLESEEYKKEGLNILSELPESFVDEIEDFITDMKSILKKHSLLIDDKLLNFFYDMNSLYYLATLVSQEVYHDAFLTYVRITNTGKLLSIRIANLNSRDIISQYSGYFTSVCYFSATLSPRSYYIELLGGNIDESKYLFLNSPFKKENRKVFIDTRLSLKYRDRNQTLYQVFSLCRNTIEVKKGNYFIFCPSFEYLDRIYSFFQQEPIENSEVIVQGRGMNEQKREEFLNCFSSNNEKTTIGLLVIGGIFSEGIDLLGDKLIGAIIISAGLPQISFERNQLKNYYDKVGCSGFSYAYTYPGINRILQAGGRVIRSEQDKGIILYIDSRFCESNYRKILSDIYPDAIKVYSTSQVKKELKDFWEEKENEI